MGRWVVKLGASCLQMIFAINAALYNLFYREVIVQGSVRWPNGLALDLVLDRFLS